MSEAEELLETVAAGPDTTEEEHIVIGKDRHITVPEALKKIAVQYDHNIETVTFDCPRYWDGIDMSKMAVYINYMTPDTNVASYPCEAATVDATDDSIMHFDWVISGNVTKINGPVSFLVCIKETDENGEEKRHWNSELNSDLYISEGLEASNEIATLEQDLITELLLRVNRVEIGFEETKTYVRDNLLEIVRLV